MYSLKVKLKDFAAAHRLIKGYRGKCNNLHGHNYFIQVVISAETIGADGLVMDFSEVRSLCDGWVQTALDHATFVCADDSELLTFLTQAKQKIYIFQENTSVEVIACEVYHQLKKIFEQINQSRSLALKLQQVEIWESRACGIIYSEQNTLQQGTVCGQ